MARYFEKWECLACGHSKTFVRSYPKNREPDTPHTITAKRARCTRCGTRGQCKITERKASKL